MALTRKALEAMGLTDNQVESIIEMHRETVDGLKEKLSAATSKADQLEAVQAELEALKTSGGDYKKRYEKEHADFEAHKKEVAQREAAAAKEKAVRSYLEGKNISGKYQEIAVRGMSREIAAVELDEKGRIKDTTQLDELVSGVYSGLASTTRVRGASTPNPPKAGGAVVKSWGEIYAQNPDGSYKLTAAERQAAIAELQQANKQ